MVWLNFIFNCFFFKKFRLHYKCILKWHFKSSGQYWSAWNLWRILSRVVVPFNCQVYLVCVCLWICHVERVICSKCCVWLAKRKKVYKLVDRSKNTRTNTSEGGYSKQKFMNIKCASWFNRIEEMSAHVWHRK